MVALSTRPDKDLADYDAGAEWNAFYDNYKVRVEHGARRFILFLLTNDRGRVRVQRI